MENGTMHGSTSRMDIFQQPGGRIRALAGLLLVFGIAGCGGTSTPAAANPQQSVPTYLAPHTAGAASAPQTFTLDDGAGVFSQSFYGLIPPGLEGSQVLNSGQLAIAQRGLRILGITTSYVLNVDTNLYDPVTYKDPKAGSFAVELAGQAGGLVQIVGQPAQPLVAATQCPNSTTAQTYQFITIPNGLASGSNALLPNSWDPTYETAYGSVDISSSGGTVNFQNIHQFTLPSAGGTGNPGQPAASSITGACGSTYFGNITNVPGQPIVKNPAAQNDIPPSQAVIGIGISGGLLVEDNGTGAGQTSTGNLPPLPYINVLGAGDGAVGLPRPSSAVDTGAVVGAQYLGFINAAGTFVSSQVAPAYASHVASFGFSSVPSSCAAVAASTPTLIYGGDFTNDDPAASPDGFGNCDFAIDLGPQDASSNGLYTQATVWVGAGYPSNTTGAGYSFPAVAIAGQVSGKYAVFLIGVDSTQPWTVYLLQSN